MQYITLYTVVEATCLIAAWIWLRGQGLNLWGLQRFYMGVVLATELSGTYIRTELHRPNLPVYNAFLVVEALTLGWILYRLILPLSPPWIRHAYPAWVVMFALVYGLEWWLDTQQYLYFNYTIVLMSLVFTVACGYYFYRLLLVKPVKNLLAYAPYWWVGGTAIFYFGGLGLNQVLDLLYQQSISIGPFYLHSLIANVLNILLYSLWTYSYLLKYRYPNS